MDLFDKESNYMNFDLLKEETITIGELMDINNDQLNLMKAKYPEIKVNEASL